MAKTIEQTPILKGKDSSRFLKILSEVDSVELSKSEKEIKSIMNTLPKKLKF